MLGISPANTLCLVSFKGEPVAESETAHARSIAALEVNAEEACAVTVCGEGKMIVWNISRVKSRLTLKPIKDVDFLGLGGALPKFSAAAALLFGATQNDRLFALNYLTAQVFCFAPVALEGAVRGVELLDAPFTFFACWTDRNEFACIAANGTVLSQVALAREVRDVVFWQNEAGFYRAAVLWEASRQMAVFSLPFCKFKGNVEAPFEVNKAVWSAKTKHLYLLGSSELDVLLEGSFEAN